MEDGVRSKALAGEAGKLTIQSDVRQDVSTGTVGSSILLYMAQQNDLVAPWWSQRRDEDLLRVIGECDVLSGALYSYTSKMAALPFRIEPIDPSVKGHWRLAEQYQTLLYEGSDFFAGWEEFFVRWLTARNGQDNGAMFEVIGAGKPDKEIQGPAVGVSFLDSARCTRTGNPEYPIVYQDVDGKYYKLHYSRVGYSSQLPSIRKEMYRVGYCAVTRALSFAQNVIDDLIYHQEKLGSRQPRAILTGSGTTPGEIQTAFEAASNLATQRGRRRYPAYPTLAKQSPITLSVVSLSDLPDGFTFETDLTLAMYAIALALGIPPRWIWPATQTGATKADAMYQHLAGSQTGPAFELRVIRNLLGGSDVASTGLGALRPRRFLPPELKMVFDLQDDEQDLQAAQIRSTRVTARTGDLASGVINARTAREQMLEEGEITSEQFEDLELADGRTPDGMDVADLIYTDNEYVSGVVPDTAQDDLDERMDKARKAYATATSAAKKSEAHQAIACLSALSKKKPALVAPPEEETPEQARPVEKPTPGEEAEEGAKGAEEGHPFYGNQWTGGGGGWQPSEAGSNRGNRVASAIGNYSKGIGDEEGDEKLLDSVVDNIKGSILDELGEEADAEYVSEEINEWAVDSNGPASVILQHAAAQEFDSPLSGFTQSILGGRRSGEEERVAVHRMYDSTQRELRRMGIGPDDTVVLYRGRSGDMPFEHGPATGNALESWSASREAAAIYATSRARGGRGYIMSAEIPAWRIFSLPHTGLGLPSVSEVVILGGKPLEVHNERP